MVKNYSRRGMLAASLGGLSLPAYLAWKQAASADESGQPRSRARSCIVLYCWGGMSHLETFDPKPEAPVEIRGEFAPIATAVPGISVSEHLPRLAGIMDRIAVIRSIHHNSTFHGKGMYWNLTGHAPPQPTAFLNLPPSSNDWPTLAAVISRFRTAPRGVPGSVKIPYPMVDNDTLQAGEYAGWLGVASDPIIIRAPSGVEYGGVSRSLGSEALNLSEGIDPRRLHDRRDLLRSLERPISMTEEFVGFEHFRELAGDLLLAPAVKQAYDLDRENPRVKELYGDHLCGRSVLLARRLTEAGVPVVTVLCSAGDLNGAAGDHWDTHSQNFSRLRQTMLPLFDRAAHALLADLHQRGTLDETLVVMLTDFGRTPRINAAAGRDHYPDVYSVFLAGGGIRGGQVYGASDAQGALPLAQACSPADVHATIFQALGISPRAEIHDRLQRPLPVSDGEVLPLFG